MEYRVSEKKRKKGLCMMRVLLNGAFKCSGERADYYTAVVVNSMAR